MSDEFTITELKNCPFCDWPARLVHRDGMYWCECRNGNCGAVQPVCNHADVAIKTWNRRTALTLSASNLTLVRKALQRYRRRIEEIGEMGWYESDEVTRQEVARVDAILVELEPTS